MNWFRRASWKMKILIGSFVLASGLWLGLAAVAYFGMKDFIRTSATNPEAESRVFSWIGPGTRGALEESTRNQEYRLIILPFDWVEGGQFVTHTALITDETHTLKIRLRFNPLDGFFHIVGYTRQPK